MNNANVQQQHLRQNCSSTSRLLVLVVYRQGFRLAEPVDVIHVNQFHAVVQYQYHQKTSQITPVDCCQKWLSTERTVTYWQCNSPSAKL